MLLRDLTARVLDKYLTEDEQKQTYTQAKAGGEIKIKIAVKYFVAYMAAETGALVNLGKGKFQRPIDTNDHVTEIEAAAIDAIEPEELDEEDDFSGWIYAFSFPSIQKAGTLYPIKIGKTANSVANRVNSQCKGSAVFETPIVLGSWNVKRVSYAESAIHSTLKARGKWRQNAVPRRFEWSLTGPAECCACRCSCCEAASRLAACGHPKGLALTQPHSTHAGRRVDGHGLGHPA